MKFILVIRERVFSMFHYYSLFYLFHILSVLLWLGHLVSCWIQVKRWGISLFFLISSESFLILLLNHFLLIFCRLSYSTNKNMNLWLTKMCFITVKRVSQNCKYSLEGFDSIYILPIYMPVMSHTLILYMWSFRFQKTSLFNTWNMHLVLLTYLGDF